jgi:DNA replication and repair protein RecF
MSHLTRLTLTAFRNYPDLRLEVDCRPIVLVGPNGAGKTNLLEAVTLLGPGRGLRTAKLSDMVAANSAAPWAVAASLSTRAGTRQVGTGPDPADPYDVRALDRRIVRIDGQNRTQGALADIASILWLSPALDRLFTEPASLRRRFLDRLVYGFDPAHAARVTRYEQALRERQKLLAEGGEAVWLDGVEMIISETGIAVTASRLATVEKLDRVLAAEQAGPFPHPELALAGQLETWLAAGSALAAEDRYRQALAANRRLDAATGRVALGAHRSELAARHREKDMPAQLCSTGEQKALLISVMLAQAGLLAAGGELPILVLDEIAAHLDETRRTALFTRLRELGLQAWLSGTDTDDFAALGEGAMRLGVAEGAVG